MEQNKKNKYLEKQLAEKDKKIKELERKVTEYKQRCSECKHLNNKIELNIKYKLIGDVENLKSDLELQKKQFKQQLAEKDKEIEEYSNYFKSFGCKNFAEFQELIGLAKVSANDKDRDDWVRHQVCEEIREKLKVYLDYTDEEHIGWYIEEENIDKILDQIEKGERK